MGVNVRVDGVMVVAALVVGVGVLAYSNKEKIKKEAEELVTKKLNPASSDNLVYKAVEGERFNQAANVVFAVMDKINPFNDSDVYADQVLGDALKIAPGSGIGGGM